MRKRATRQKLSSQSAARPDRRQILGGLAGAGLAANHAFAAAARSRKRESFDAKLQDAIRNVVVIYAENRSFNNLFSNFPGLRHPLAAVTRERMQQRDRDGTVLTGLPPIWGGLVPTGQTLDSGRYQIGETAITGLANAAFALRTPDGTPLPHGLVTRDLAHLFYHNQMQINGGRNDSFVAWGDSGALVMGHYADTAAQLRIAALARRYTLCDNFFMGAFGGSFLNHQYLVAAQPPFYPGADNSAAAKLIADVEGGDPAGTRLKRSPGSPDSALTGPPDFWAVNTMFPAYPPSARDPSSPLLLPPQTHKNIGDLLTGKGVAWGWYAGAWQAALDGQAERSPSFPPKPNFQLHHQPLNYFLSFAPDTTQRAQALRDGGLGSTPDTNRFMAAAQAGTLPPVAFYKPEGDLNMHAGYSDVEDGDRHIDAVIQALQQSPQWKNMLVVITFDENGGWWDHVAPPLADRWGPGTRIPAILISPHVKNGHVEHTVYDTGSILRFITRRFGLEKLPGLQLREQEMTRREGFAPGDLTEALAI
jgi:acid phosphatase